MPDVQNGASGWAVQALTLPPTACAPQARATAVRCLRIP